MGGKDWKGGRLHSPTLRGVSGLLLSVRQDARMHRIQDGIEPVQNLEDVEPRRRVSQPTPAPIVGGFLRGHKP